MLVPLEEQYREGAPSVEQLTMLLADLQTKKSACRHPAIAEEEILKIPFTLEVNERTLSNFVDSFMHHGSVKMNLRGRWKRDTFVDDPWVIMRFKNEFAELKQPTTVSAKNLLNKIIQENAQELANGCRQLPLVRIHRVLKSRTVEL